MQPADRAVYSLFVVTLWLALINGIIFTPDPSPLMAGDANYSLTFTPEAGDPLKLEMTLTSMEPDIETSVLFQLHFND
jgi:hypothetical protein